MGRRQKLRGDSLRGVTLIFAVAGTRLLKFFKGVFLMKEKKKSVISTLMQYAGAHRFLTYSSWVLASISAVLALCPFYFIWRLIKEVLLCNGDFSNAQGLKVYGWYAVLSSLVSILIYIAALMCSHLSAFRIKTNLTIHVMNHIMTLPLGLVQKEGSGKIRKIVVDSTGAAESFLAHSLPDKAVSYITPIGLIFMMVFFNWKIGLLCLIPAVIAFLSMGPMMGEKMKKDMEQYQIALESMSNEAVEYVRGIPVVKTFGQSVNSFNRFKKSIDDYEKWTVAYTKSMCPPMIGFMTATNSIFLFIIFASYWLGSKGLDSSLILNILFYIILTPLLTVTLMKVAYAGETQMVVEEALNRINWILGLKPLAKPVTCKEAKDGSIKIENVSFKYEEDKPNAIDGISLQIPERSFVALVGPSGSGKSTLCELIARFWDVNGGSIKIGGVDVKNIEEEKLMETVSFVFQDSNLLKTSILENVRLGNPSATKEEVLQALKDAQCEDILQKLPDGLETVIGSKGTYVSGGEAQRLCIARAFLKKSKILILDEATAFSDPENEEKVLTSFKNLAKNKTVIMIAHRLSTVVNADKIFVLSNGKIAEEGNHKTLVEKGGLYSHMWAEFNKATEWRVN